MVNHGDRHRAPVLFQNLWIRPCLPLSTSKKLFRAWQFLSVRNDLTNFQDELFVTSHFLVTSWKKVLMSFLCSETRLFIWVLKKSSFSLDGFFKKLFLRRLRLYISFLKKLISFFTKGIWFLLRILFFIGACYCVTLGNVLERLP